MGCGLGEGAGATRVQSPRKHELRLRLHARSQRRRRHARRGDRGSPFTLTARAENLIRGNPDLDDTIARLQAYEQAGADVLYAPGLETADEIRTVCSAVSKPVNVLARPQLTMAEIAGAGAKRISVGGALTWVAAGALVSAAGAMLERGDFSALAAGVDIEDWL